MPTDATLRRQRWTDDEGRLAQEVIRRLQRNGRLTDLGLGEIDGRIDLRGLTNARPARRATAVAGVERGRSGPAFLSLPLVRRLRLAHLDLTGARLEDWLLRKVDLVDCVFEGARLDLSLFGGTVSESRFSGADLRSLTADGTTFRATTFERADLRRATIANVTFEDVVFDHANLRDVEFPDSRFVRCRFAGRLDGTMFGEAGPEDALDGTDFGDAELVLVRFRRLNLAGIVPPRHPDNLVIRNIGCVVDRLEAEIAATPDHPIAWMTYSRLEWRKTGAAQTLGIFHRAELSPTDDPADAQPAIDALLRLERACAAGSPPA